jgi:hypothetical protein
MLNLHWLGCLSRQGNEAKKSLGTQQLKRIKGDQSHETFSRRGIDDDSLCNLYTRS